jgi:hypothetical protein
MTFSMAPIEKSVKAQFAKVFTSRDWPLFKEVAESSFKEAAALKKADMKIKRPLQLLVRNSRKRLLIGVGVELLVKAVFLKHGYAINEPEGKLPKFPFLVQSAAGVKLVDDKTATLSELIQHLPRILDLKERKIIIRGLTIAKVFRNKEGHTVTRSHKFDKTNYKDISSALSELYRDAFGQTLTVNFSLAPKEQATWELSPTKRPVGSKPSTSPCVP